MRPRTFCFIGVAGVNITQDLPRSREIINVSKSIITPTVACSLLKNKQIEVENAIKAQLENIYLYDILRYVEAVWQANAGSFTLRVKLSTFGRLAFEH